MFFCLKVSYFARWAVWIRSTAFTIYFFRARFYNYIINKILNEDSFGVLAFMFFFGMLAAPVVEELLFRGFLQTAVRTTFGKLKAILISGFLFALIHLNAHVFLQIFILGLLLAYLFEKTGALIAPITVHVCHNTATLAFLISFKHILKSHV